MLNAQSTSAVALDTIGANGLDTQSSPTTLPNTWFTSADNIAYATGGKISLRKGAIQGTPVVGSPIGSLVEHKDSAATRIFVSYGGDISTLELSDRAAPFKDTYSPTGVTTSDWKWANFNNKLIGVQAGGVKPVVYDGDTLPKWSYLEDVIDTTVEIEKGDFIEGKTYKITEVHAANADWSSVGGSTTAEVGDIFVAISDGGSLAAGDKANPGFTKPEGITDFNPTCSLGYYGRLWVGGIEEEKDILHYSSLLDESNWWTAYGDANDLNDAGYIDLKTVWGHDEIVAIEAHAGKLAIFGRNNIALYNVPRTVGSMYLEEVIRGIGCVARDSIQTVGDDILFLSDTGVRSLTRTAEFDKLPLKEISITVKDDLMLNVKRGGAAKSVYMEDEGLYLLSFPETEEIFVFDLTYTTEIGTPRVTKWSWTGGRHPTALAYTRQSGLLLGQKLGRVATYGGNQDKAFDGSGLSYTGNLSSVWIDLGQGVRASILKKLELLIAGGQRANIGLRVYRDLEMTPIVYKTFRANPTLSGIPYLWSSSITEESKQNAARAVAQQISKKVVGLAGDATLDALIKEAVIYDFTGGTNNDQAQFVARGDVNHSLLSASSTAVAGGLGVQVLDATEILQYAAGHSMSEASYNWIQTYIIDYMLSDLDTYGIYFNTADTAALYGCDVSYDYGDTGFCSISDYINSTDDYKEGDITLMEHRTEAACLAEGDVTVDANTPVQLYQWNETPNTAGIDQPANCSARPAKFAPRAGYHKSYVNLAGTATYMKLEMDLLPGGHPLSLQSLSLLFKRGKTL